MHFGEHLMIDGYGGDEALLDDKNIVLACLDELPELLGMKKLSEPEIFHAEPNDAKDPGGWTGIVTIAESHISIHTFPKRGFVSADVYTCKNDMDTTSIIKFFKEKFNLQELETNFVVRGTRYPKKNIY